MMFKNLRLKRRSRWLSPVFQLALGLVFCIVLPLVLLTWSLPKGWMESEAFNSALAASAGLVVGFWLHRSVVALPGTRESSGILPAYGISFGLVLIVILMSRIDYSRSILLVSFILSIGWFFLVYVVTQRQTSLTLGIVEGGNVGLFDEMAGVEVERLGLDSWPNMLDAVVADFRHDHTDEWEARLADFVLAGVPVYHSKDLYESLTGRADLEHLSENNFGALGPQLSLLFAKVLIDRLIALPTLIVLSPLLIATAITIRLDTPGPALFRQVRVGYRGRKFTVYKFRTMLAHDDRKEPRARDYFITLESDRRITRVGRFLRRSRIDELPQIINILRGEMSWIGPRPEASQLAAWYQSEIPFYRYRHVVRPGVTGWAQVNQGHVTDIAEIKTKLQFDFYYIRNFSAWLDLLIIMKTVKTMLTGFGHK